MLHLMGWEYCLLEENEACFRCHLVVGDNAIETKQGLRLVYMHAGTNPFEVISEAVK